MATKSKKSKETRESKPTFFSSFNIDKIIPSKFQTPVYLVLILILFLIFLSPLYFGGKTFQSGDIVTSKSMETYLEKDREGYTLWNPYVFGGMPAYALAAGYKWFNLIWVGMNTVRSIFMSPFTVDYAKWTFYLIALAYAMFVFFKNKTGNKLVSLMVALGSSFSTGIIVFLYIGHVTKLTSLWVFPVLLLLLFNFQKKIKLIDFLILIIFLNIMFLGWHVQIIFYIFFAVLIYFLYFYFSSLKLKDKHLSKQLVKSAAVFISAVVIALLIQLDNFTQIYEYTSFSTRGSESILENQQTQTKQSESDFYQYATNWSFSPGEVLTFIIPSYYGFGKSTYQGPLSQNQPVEVNTYFGQMPFVDVAMYMGVIIFFLALFSVVVNWKDPLVKFLTILSFIALLISFGRSFPILYDLMFNYFPFFDKFRVPSMILVLVQLSFPILAGLGVVKIISAKKEKNEKLTKLIKNSAIVFTGLFILTLLLGSPIKEWFISRVVETGQRGTQLQPLHPYMSDMFINDARLAFLFTAIVFGLSYSYLKSKLSADLLVIGIIAFIIIDLFRINFRGETLEENQRIESLFNKPDYLQAIDKLEDKSLYRILNLKQDGSIGSMNQNSNYLAYFLEYDIYGYSGIKPRAIQDYYDVLISPANITFWRMLNVKYLIFDTEVNYPGLEKVYAGNKTFVYRNKYALPRVYFVNRVEQKSGLEILNSVKQNQFDPREVAYTENLIKGIEIPDSTASVSIVRFDDEHLEFEVNTSGKNFLFIGDTYMSGKADYNILKIETGWKAYIDGEETEIHKTNHGFRGVVVPKGKHKVELRFSPQSFVVSKYLAFSISSIVLIGLIVTVFYEKKRSLLTTERDHN